jgi:Protein of unknown function (DUF2510)
MSGSRAQARWAPGWYADPNARYELRYHNGDAWTADVSSDGARFIDPLGASPVTAEDRDHGKGHGRATASMVLGIIAVAVGWLPYVAFVGAICAVLAIALGISARRRSSRSGLDANRARVGLTTGLVGVAVAAVGIAFTLIVNRALDRYAHPNTHEATITSCEADGEAATATGELRNLGTTEADFTVRVAFVRGGTDNSHRTGTVEVSDVEAGATGAFEVTVNVALDDVECRVADVDGPLPFGLDLPT